MKIKVPVCEPYLDKDDLHYVNEAVKSGWISSLGKFTRDFEKAFSKFCGVKYGVSCSSGTSALHLALLSCGVDEGDEVILPTLTMISTVNAVAYVRANPVLVDSEEETWNMNPDLIERKITKKTKAILIVHLYGHPVDMDPVRYIAKKYNLWVIEDSAEAHGAEYKGKRVGGLSDVACFSFYANKIITTGEGGMVVTNNKRIAEIASNLRDLAFSKDKHFWHRRMGFNYRMSNLQAAIGLGQMRKIDKLIKLRRNHAKYYTALLKRVEGIKTPPEKDWAKNVFWMYGILIDKRKFGLSRDKVMRALLKRGIETRTFFYPVHWQPLYRGNYKNERFPVADKLSRQGLLLPSGSTLTNDDIEYVVHTIKKIQK